MSTPNFVSQGSESLTEVRMHTPLDPYHYTVDNRPLQDLDNNIKTVASGGVDSARRAVLLTQLSTSDVFRQLFKVNGTNQVISGLEVEYPGTNYVKINAGAVYSAKDMNSFDTTKVVKQGLLIKSQNLTFSKPVQSDTSIIYVLAGRYKDLIQTSMSSSTLPYLDDTNPFLPCLLLNGELEVKLVPGTSANSGAEVAPTVEAGWFPIYEITSSYASPTPAIKLSPAAPNVTGLKQALVMTETGVNAATFANFNGILTPRFVKAANSSVNLKLSLRGTNINPYASVKFKILYSGSLVNGNFAMRSQVGSYAVGSVASASPTNISNAEALPCDTGVIDGLKSIDSSIISISPRLFAGFVNNVWVLNKDFLNVSLYRDVSSQLDTNTGNLFIHEVVAFQ